MVTLTRFQCDGELAGPRARTQWAPALVVVEFCFPLTNARFGDFKDVSTSLPCVFVVLASWSPLQTRTARLRGLPSNEIDPNFDLPGRKIVPKKGV